MNCSEVRNHLSAYQDRMLDPTLAAAVEEHLRSCITCAAEAAALSATRARVHGLPAKKAPPGFLQAVRARIDEPARRENRGFFARWGVPLEFAGLAAGLVFVVLFSDVLTRSRKASEQLLVTPAKEPAVTVAPVTPDAEKGYRERGAMRAEPVETRSESRAVPVRERHSAEKAVRAEIAAQPVAKSEAPTAPAPVADRAVLQSPQPEPFNFSAAAEPDVCDTVHGSGRAAAGAGITAIGNLLKAKTGIPPKAGVAPAALSDKIVVQQKTAVATPVEPGAVRLSVARGLRDSVVRAITSDVQQMTGTVNASRVAGAVHLLTVTIPASRSTDLHRDLARLGTVDGSFPQPAEAQSTLTVTITVAEKPAR
jgi:anti-sigma factor RsiW